MIVRLDQRFVHSFWLPPLLISDVWLRIASACHHIFLTYLHISLCQKTISVQLSTLPIIGYLQWGNVYLCKAKRIVDKAAAEGKPLSECAEAAEEWFSKAEGRYEEVIKTKPDFYDGLASLANLSFERGKLAAGFAVPPSK